MTVDVVQIVVFGVALVKTKHISDLAMSSYFLDKCFSNLGFTSLNLNENITWMVGRDSLEEPSAVMLDLSERLQAFMMLVTTEGLKKVKQTDFKQWK